MSKRKEVFKESMDDQFGNKVSPGDKVVAITTSYGHSVNIRQGVYLGCHKDSSWNGEEKKYAVVEHVYDNTVWVETDDPTETPRSWSYLYNKYTKPNDGEPVAGKYKTIKVSTVGTIKMQLNRMIKV